MHEKVRVKLLGKKPTLKMTNKEYSLVMKELTDRVKDTMFIYKGSKKILECLSLDDTYTLHITIIGADIMQILGRVRRNGKA